jgi:hypothetical protein
MAFNDLAAKNQIAVLPIKHQVVYIENWTNQIQHITNDD